MAQITERQHLEEQLGSLKTKLAAELAKEKTDDNRVQSLTASIEHTQATLTANDPKLDKPHGFDFGGVDPRLNSPR